MAFINSPPIGSDAIDENGRLANALGNWFMQVFRICFDAQNSGTTANRPTTNLYPGKFYFDTSLGANGKPIWQNKTATGWVDATGAGV
jgi:hypothetical protein